MKKGFKLIVPSLLAILVCVLLLAGSTFALFTSDVTKNIVVGSATVNMTAEYTEFKAYSVEADDNGTAGEATAYGVTSKYKYSTEDVETVVANSSYIFANKGTAKLTDENTIELVNVTPGDRITANLKVTNNSNVDIIYRVRLNAISDNGLLDGLTVKAGGETLTGVIKVGEWTPWNVPTELTKVENIALEVFLPVEAGNEYQTKQATLRFTIEAVQANAKTDTLLDQVNAYLAGTSSPSKNNTMYDAIQEVKGNTEFAAFDATKYLWSPDTDQFYAPYTVVAGFESHFFKAYLQAEFNELIEQKYNIYAIGEWTGSINITVGFDAGEATGITSINYDRHDATTAQKVVIRTNGGTLTVNAENDEVTHYGQVDYVDIIAVKSSSYKERGTTSLIKVAKGNVALNSESKVGEIHFAKTGDVFTDIKVSLESGAKLPDLSRDPVGTSGLENVLICEVVESGTSEFYWLNAKGTIEDGEVLVSSTKTGDKTVATAENSTAVAIANAKSGETVTDNGATVKPASEMSAEELLQATASGAAKTFAEINSKEKLLAFRDAWNAGKLATGTFKLTANIDISGEDWLPIGTWEYPFNGTFDGNGKTIIGLTKTRLASEDVYSEGSSTKYNGVVFGFIAIAGGGDVEVKNLTLSNVNISLSSAANSSALIGYAPANGDFTSSSKGDAYWASTETEGKKVLPSNYGKDDITLTNVSVSGSISAKQHIGGLIGKAYNTGDISVTDCSFIGDVTISATTGGAAGIIGWPSGYSTITVKGCTVEGNIKGGTPNKGTLVGRLDSISKNTVLDRNTTSNAHVLDANDVEVPQNLTVNYEYNSDGSVKTVTVNGTSIPYNTRVYENCVVSINTGTYYTLTDCEVYNSAFTSYVDIYGSISFDGCSFIYFNRAGNTSPKFDQPWTVSLTNTNMTSYTFRVKNGQNLTLNNNVKFTFKPNASGNTDYSVSGSNNTEKQANSYHVRVCNGGYLTLNSSYSYETVANTTAYYTNYNVNEDNGFLVYLEVGSIFNSETVTEAHFIWVKAK